VNPKDMTKYDLFYRAQCEQCSLSDIYPQENVTQSETPAIDELYRRLDEADALLKENAELRESLVSILPLREDGSIKICELQRKFRLGYNQARRIADAVDRSTARIMAGSKESESSHE